MQIRIGNPSSAEVAKLLDELSGDLAMKTGRDGRASFHLSDVEQPRSVLLVAYEDEEPLGCGALRPITEDVCEVKRMYVRTKGLGVGSRILDALEQHARQLHYKQAWIETGIENQRAVKFYLGHGYKVMANFGRYQGRSDCVCFQKDIS